ncbi:hypothetical protein CSIM01_13453 [Colletotrichum simmondsii]|uniref:Uncharacterized protein n=1 Tax=Colletotrichum simmondsii TaxID=703756 RepID=A0A135SN99_9PEZI|nr:hypothetical protein CSIM01_13453 [Colletotrichum simmondsii]
MASRPTSRYSTGTTHARTAGGQSWAGAVGTGCPVEADGYQERSGVRVAAALVGVDGLPAAVEVEEAVLAFTGFGVPGAAAGLNYDVVGGAGCEEEGQEED